MTILLRQKPLTQVVRQIVQRDNGAWFDPSDLSTLYQDAAGTTPVTAVEQPVGLMLDKSQGLMLGPELVSNGNFDNGASGWTLGTGLAVTTGTLICNTSSNERAEQSGQYNSGVIYKVTLNVTSYTSGAPFISIGQGSTASIPYPNVLGAKILYVKAGSSDSIFRLYPGGFGVGGVVSFDNISVREIYGNHATQSVTASRPVLSARYNLLTNTNSNLTSDTGWAATNISGALQADGSSLIARITPTNAYASSATSLSLPIGTTATFSAKLKCGTVGGLYGLRISGSYPDRADAVFNLNTGTLVFCAGVNYLSVTATISNPDTEGFYAVTLTCTSANTPIVSIIHGPAVGAHSAWEGAGSTLLNGFIKTPQLVVGAPIPQYQLVNTNTDYDTDERYFPKYLRFDGIDDYLTLGDVFDIGSEGVSIATSVILFNATKSPIAGKSRAGATGGRYFLGTEPGSFLFASHDSAPPVNIAYSQSIGESVVLSAKLGPHGNRSLSLYKNANLLSTVNTSLTTASYDTTDPFWIGAYPNSTGTTPAYAYLNGGIYGLIITKSALTDAQRVRCERFLARKAGVML